jgi:hypothetical protein
MVQIIDSGYEEISLVLEVIKNSSITLERHFDHISGQLKLKQYVWVRGEGELRSEKVIARRIQTKGIHRLFCSIREFCTPRPLFY